MVQIRDMSISCRHVMCVAQCRRLGKVVTCPYCSLEVRPSPLFPRAQLQVQAEENVDGSTLGPDGPYTPRTRASLRWIACNTRRCPGCGIGIIKNGGCHTVTCTLCNQTFIHSPNEVYAQFTAPLLLSCVISVAAIFKQWDGDAAFALNILRVLQTDLQMVVLCVWLAICVLFSLACARTSAKAERLADG